MTLIQYVVLRGDLSWGAGALIAQACHASVSAIIKYIDDEKTQSYVQKLDHMHKVILKAENEEQLNSLASELRESNVPFYSWIEQPENVQTCIATAPREKQTIAHLFKHLKVFR